MENWFSDFNFKITSYLSCFSPELNCFWIPWIFHLLTFSLYVCIRITLKFVAKKTNIIKVIQNFMAIRLYFNHFSEKTCWKKLFHFQFGLLFFDICCLFWQNGASAPVVGTCWRTRQQNKCQTKVQIKTWITSLGIVCQKNDKTKCDLELNNE